MDKSFCQRYHYSLIDSFSRSLFVYRVPGKMGFYRNLLGFITLFGFLQLTNQVGEHLTEYLFLSCHANI